MTARAPLALAALLGGAATIGTSALFVKVSEAGPISTAFWRVCLALPVFFVWMWLEQRHRPQANIRSDGRMLAVVGLFFAADLAFWHWSIVLTSVANATLLANCAPIFVTLGVWIFLRQKPRPVFLGGLATALVGMALLVRGDFAHGGRALLGDALGVATALFYGSYQLSLSRARRTSSTARIMAIGGAISALILLPIALLSGEQFMPSSAYGWLLLFGLALLCQAAGQGLIAYAMAHLPATFSSVGLLVQPVVAAALAWVLLGEALTALAIAGGVLVLVGIRVAHGAERDA